MAVSSLGPAFLERPPGPGFAMRLVCLEPGERLPYRSGEWARALVIVEAGTIELETTAGTCARFRARAVLHLDGLPLAAIRNPGAVPAILSAVTRQVDPLSPNAHD